MFIHSSRRGFTLIETLVTIAIFGTVIVAAGDLLRVIFASTTTNPAALNAVDQAQSAASLFVNQVRDGSYGNDGSFPLNQASTSQIIFFSPFGSSDPTTMYRYRYFISTSTLYEGVTVPSGSPLSYNTANEKLSALVSGVSVGTSSLFSYYGGTYAGTTSPLTQPVNVNQVTYVQMSFYVNLNERRGATTTSFISTGATIRNLKINLGN